MLLKITPHMDTIILFATRPVPILVFGDFLPLLDGGVADLSSNSTPCSSSKHLAIILRAKEGNFSLAKVEARGDNGQKTECKVPSNSVSSVGAEKGPPHSLMLRWKENPEEGASCMQMSRYRQPIE